MPNSYHTIYQIDFVLAQVKWETTKGVCFIQVSLLHVRLIFAESLRIEEHPTSQETKEGSTVEFKCKVQGKKKVLYQWLKDGAEIQGQNSCTLVLDSVKLRDFGCYACEVRYADSQLGSECVESSPAELDVTPCDGMSKYFYYWLW